MSCHVNDSNVSKRLPRAGTLLYVRKIRPGSWGWARGAVVRWQFDGLHRCSQPCSRRDVGSHTHDTRRSSKLECPSPPTHTVNIHLISLGSGGRASRKPSHAQRSRGSRHRAFGLWRRDLCSRVRMHARARLTCSTPPPRGRLAAHRYHALAVSLSHGTCGVACRPWGCSTRRQPMLRCATTTHRITHDSDRTHWAIISRFS